MQRIPGSRALARCTAHAALAASAATTFPAHAGFTLTELARPGAASTSLFDVNNSGLMAGYSTTGSGAAEVMQGFVYDGTNFTSLTGPSGSVGNVALGLSDTGIVVGSSYASRTLDTDGKAAYSMSRGFLYAGGSYTSFEVSGAVDTFLRGISPDGRYITGYYSTSSQPGVGFVYDLLSSELSNVSSPNSILTIAQGVNNAGFVVGSDVLSGPPTTRPGFTYDRSTGTRTDVILPGASRTALRALDEDGDLAGWFIDAGGATHGFFGSLAQYEQIDFPGAVSTFVEGSNDSDMLVGSFDNGQTFGAFIAVSAVPEPANWVLMAVGLLITATARRQAMRQATPSA